MNNYMMMVGRLNEENKGYRVLNVEDKTVTDFSEEEIIKLLNSGEAKILNLEVNENGELVCPHDINNYGVVGKSNAFVVISKKIIDASMVDGVSFEIADVNGLVKNYYQSDAVSLSDFYEFANVRVNIMENTIRCLGNSKIYIQSALNLDERKARAIAFVKELQKSSIKIMCHKIPYKNESPSEYALNVLGRIGRIETAPGTETFNKNIVEKLKFEDVSIDGNCRFIQPTYGRTESYYGWKTNSSQVSKLPNAEFIISAIGFYTDDFLDGEKYRKNDYAYCVHVKSVGAYVYVLENDKIGQIRLYNLG